MHLMTSGCTKQGNLLNVTIFKMLKRWRYMSGPTRKPPLWHFTHSDAIRLHCYNVLEDDDFTNI